MYLLVGHGSHVVAAISYECVSIPADSNATYLLTNCFSSSCWNFSGGYKICYTLHNCYRSHYACITYGIQLLDIQLALLLVDTRWLL